MAAICLIDTTVFMEILNVPGKASDHKEAIRVLRSKIDNRETLFLPMATILESGNHIAQIRNGKERRSSAENFVYYVQKALDGCSPFKPLSFLAPEQMQLWLKDFPESAMRGRGLGDLSIIHDFHGQCSRNPHLRVYIWSLDVHLSSLKQEGRIR
ncbi:hypothetical protein [Methanothrix sp.]|uniref:hypothetical protein n=1 Tax=Methanothrix sp. TaxID=90426 RepID=UPI0032994424